MDINQITNKLTKKPKNNIASIIAKYESQTRVSIKEILDKTTIPDLTTVEVGKINQILPDTINALFGKENGLNDIFLDNDFEGVICSIIDHIKNDKSFNDFVISIGMGGSTFMPNVRLPAYLSSAINSLNKINDLFLAGKIRDLPKVKIFKADHIASYVNGFDINQMKKVTYLTFKFLESFLDKFFPHLKSSFTFESDNEEIVNKESSTHQEIKEISNILLEELSNDGSNINQEIKSILKMGEKYGGKVDKQKSLFYAAAHPIYTNSATLKNKANNFSKDSVIIKHGGRSEKIFNQTSSELIKYLRQNNSKEYNFTPTVGMITNAGKVPVYYPARDGDLPLGKEYIDYQNLDRQIHRDYKAIFDIVHPAQFKEFIKRFNKEYKSKIQKILPLTQ